MTSFSAGATGVSPGFAISAEEFQLVYLTAVTNIQIDGVRPPTLGPGGGVSAAFNALNLWSPWVDEKLVEPKFDGVCKHLSQVSNRPSYVKDYHVITIMRAVDYVLAPTYWGVINASVDTVIPASPPTP